MQTTNTGKSGRARRLVGMMALALMMILTGCGDASDTEPGQTNTSNGTATSNNTSGTTGGTTAGPEGFVSADGYNGEQSRDNEEGTDANAGADDGGGGEERTVEEGDIYRVLSEGRILNLNAYRGLQIIDVSDPTEPNVMGRVQVSGHPVELYVVGDRAYVMLNNWYGYYGSRDDINVERYYGGLVVVADISDPTRPRITGQAQVPGWIRTSRLTRGNGQEALFVVSNNWEGDSHTVVRSFTVSDAGELTERTTLDLGGYVMDVQATPQALMVARYDWNDEHNRQRVSLVDISDPEGNMVEGAAVQTAGVVFNKTNMDIYNGVLRIASSSSWSGSNTNHLQTWDVSDIHNPTVIDHATYGDGEQLYATLFLDNKAFVVTYRRVDPFHAFEITDEGIVTEKAEYIISGWNNFFRPVFDDTRIIGIGVDDQEGQTMAVSLYDITDLENPEPFITRKNVTQASNSWSEANWDDRAFSVLEDAVSVMTEDGVEETGLVLLPFTGYDSDYRRYNAGVQIFTFSEDTLTARGVMDHGTPVRRSFLANDTTTANLSEAALSLFDHTSPDTPEELGKVELAPNYADFFVINDDYGARLKYVLDYYGWWGGQDTELPANVIEIVPLGEDPDAAEPVATIDIPARARVHQVGDLLVAIETTYIENTNPQEYQSVVQVFDLSNPTTPTARGSMTTTEITPGYGYYGWGVDDCWDCGWYGYWYGGATAHAMSDSLVFVANYYEQESVGQARSCNYWPAEDNTNCEYPEGDEEREGTCTYYTGGIYCNSLNGGEENCNGEIWLCEQDMQNGQSDCTEVDPETIELRESCHDYEQYRYWNRYAFQPLDLTNPDAPAMAPSVEMPRDEEDVSVLAKDDTLYVSYKEPFEVDGDSRPYVRFFYKTISMENPAQPQVGPAVNVPGQLVAVSPVQTHNADDTIILTRDFHWGDAVVESSINRLFVRDNVAYLQGTHRFADQQVYQVMLDGEGHALITHRIAWQAANQDPNFDWSEERQKLTLLDITTPQVPLLAEVEVDDWASLADAGRGRAVFNVPGGLLVMNVSNPESPFAQAYFPLRGWGNKLKVHDDTIYFPAGRYGLYSFGLNDFNLLLH